MGNKSNEHEQSPLIQFAQEHITNLLNEGKLYKKVNRKIILDNRLSINDLSIYLSILKYSSFDENYFQSITQNQIKEICQIENPNQIASISKLSDFGYIEVRYNGNCNEYKINQNQKQFLQFSLGLFENLGEEKRHYIYLLKGLFLSWGNDTIPRYKTCVKNMCGNFTRNQYRIIRGKYNDYEDEELDITRYLQLQLT